MKVTNEEIKEAQKKLEQAQKSCKHWFWSSMEGPNSKRCDLCGYIKP